MTQDITPILKALTARGYRITKARTAVIEALATQSTPHTLVEFIEHLDSDETTLYRTMSMLVDEGIVEAIVVRDGETRFALAHGHHHHLVCSKCGLIEHLPCSTPAPTLKSHPFASVTSHEVTFYGICKPCAG